MAFLILLILFVAVIILVVVVSSNDATTDSPQENLSRREYYNDVYLKSDAWKRKRFVVLRRDNWRCKYCGGRATQVHHLRYAKRNIGKEPIEWLVSVCQSCHDAQHN